MTYVSKRPPRAKQAEAIKFLEGKDVAALLMAMRTGKTKVIVDDWGRRNDCPNLLVIAPAGAYLPWGDGVYLDLPEPAASQTKVFTWVSKTRKKDAPRLSALFAHPHRRVLLINIEAISSVKEARIVAEQFLKLAPTMIAIDESVIIKNRTSKASKFCVETLAPLSKCKRILTGLVAPRDPLDVYQQFRFLDVRIFPETFEIFRDKYCIIKRICHEPPSKIDRKFREVFGLRSENIPYDKLRAIARVVWPDGHVDPLMVKGMISMLSDEDKVAAIFRAGRWIQSIPLIIGFRNIEELHQRIAPYSFRCRLEDCYDMPESDYSFRDVDMTEEQEKAYEELKLFATTELANQKHVTAQNVITQIMKLHQILCGHGTDEEGNSFEIPEKRTASMVQMLQDYEGKAIIWCSYDADVRKVTAALEKTFGEGCVSRFWGGNRDTREDEERAFKTDPAVRFMVATPDAGGRGRTWDCADLVVYHSCRNNLDHRMQSEERAKMVGKTRMVSYVDMRVPGTVEDKILEALRKKQNLAAVISGDDYRKWLI